MAAENPGRNCSGLFACTWQNLTQICDNSYKIRYEPQIDDFSEVYNQVEELIT